MKLSLTDPHPDHGSAWTVDILDGPLLDALQLEPGQVYRWEELIAKAAAIGLPVGHPVLAFCYAQRELSAVANLQRGEAGPRAQVVA